MIASTITTLRGQLAGHQIWLVRLVWLAIMLLFVTLLWQNLPFAYFDTRREWQVGQAMAAALRLFPSLDSFIYTLIGVRLLTLSLFWGPALLLAWRRWDDSYVLYVSATLVMSGFLFGQNMDVDVVRYPGWLETFFPAIRAVVPTVMLVSLIFFFFLFPDGRFVPRWLGWLTLPAILITVAIFAETSFWGRLIERLLGAVALPIADWWIFWGTVLLTMVIGLVSQLLRYRRTPAGAARQQTKWVIFGLVAIFLVPLVTSILFALLIMGEGLTYLWTLFLYSLVPTTLPITITIAVLRYRLWAVDLLLNRTLVFGGLTLLVALVYALVVGLLGALFQNLGSTFLAVLATGFVAVLFNPLRGRLQAGVNRLLYGERDNPLAILTALGQQLEATPMPGSALTSLVASIARVLKLPYVAIHTGSRELAASGSATGHQLFHLPLTYQGQPLGELVVGQRAANEAFTEQEGTLLRQLARQAGPAVYAEQLTAELRHSRQQLVTAREEERRRLRRDLHDGLGPQLATLIMKVSTAQTLLASEPDEAAHLLAQVKGEAQHAVAEVRRVVDGLRPAALDQLGLLSALQEFVVQQGDAATSFVLAAPETLPALPAAVEVAAYRIITEAVTNVRRHAQARTCQINLTLAHALDIEICDDGIGLVAEYRPGLGLTSMRARALELAGHFAIEATPGRGTTVKASLPLDKML